MQSETGFPSSYQLKSYVASKSRLKLAARAVLSADAGLLVTLLSLQLDCISGVNLSQSTCTKKPSTRCVGGAASVASVRQLGALVRQCADCGRRTCR